MRAYRSTLRRRVAVAVLALPLLETGACLQTSQNALIDGFFNAFTPLLIQWVEDQLPATAPAEAGTDPGEG